MIQAIVGMWRKVGIDANLDVYEIAKHFELRARHALAPAAFHKLGDAIDDPATSTGFAMFGPSPHRAWKRKDLVERIGPLWGEKDEAKRRLVLVPPCFNMCNRSSIKPKVASSSTASRSAGSMRQKCGRYAHGSR